MTTNAELSRLLWDARESVDTLIVIVESRSGRRDTFNRKLLADLDAYRAEQGWSPDGFGGET
jgi:hypothetical protein